MFIKDNALEQFYCNTMLYWFAFARNDPEGITVLTADEMREWAKTFDKNKFIEHLDEMSEFEEKFFFKKSNDNN